MSALLMTGFPGFLGSALLPRLLARRPDARAVCLVQARYMPIARARANTIEAEHPGVRGRLQLIEGDITAPGLGIGPDGLAALDDVTEVWHLAAVYDLAAAAETARRVNVLGTAHVLDFCRSRPAFRRLQYVSTCYVSGRYDGEFTEDDLDAGQVFRNHYESTKYEAEVLVRKAMADELPATVYRPGIVVGDSQTGETLKYDGPYFLATFMRRQPGPVAVVPQMADPDEVRFGLVPRDFVIAAMDELSVLDHSAGRTYALTDPHPPTVRQLVDTFARHLRKRVVWVPLPLGLTRAAIGLPGVERLLGVPTESLDYFTNPTTYSTRNTVADLAGTGVECPPFEHYAGRLLEFMRTHPEIGSRAMV